VAQRHEQDRARFPRKAGAFLLLSFKQHVIIAVLADASAA
jgi:hypothetical protein